MTNPPAYALDTSFVVCLLTRSPFHLFQKAALFLERTAPENPKVHIPNLVLAEAYFALRHHYQYPKADALEVLRSLSAHPAITVSVEATSVLALPDLSSTKPGFVDRLIHCEAQAAGSTLVTFEKAALKLPQTRVLEG